MSKARVQQKVFGLGLSKTGTTSLAAALNSLGIKTIHFPHDEQTYRELTSGQYRLSILEEYDGAVDNPIAPYYAQLDKVYPGSKFILTVRDKDSWLRSSERHWRIKTEEKRRKGELDKFVQFNHAVVFGTIDFNPDRFSWVYDTHERNVRQYFADRPDDLLILDICGGNGWEKLCGFLSLEVPQIPFPYENRYRTITDRLQALGNIGALVAPGETYVLIDENLLWDAGPVDRHPIPFLERDGQYWGLPADDETAIQELERLRAKGASHAIFVWSAFWWLDHYADFREHLESQYACTVRNEWTVAFDLHRERTEP
jgi:hypothetical protein